MEEKLDVDVHKSWSFRKSIHAKLTSSPKMRKKERKQDSGFWIFKKKRTNGLDRGMSSSQPNLTSSVTEGERSRCGTPEQSACRAAAEASSSSLGAEIQSPASKPTLSHLVHKTVLQEPELTEDAVEFGSEEQVEEIVDMNTAGGGNTQPSLPVSTMYQLDVVLKRGNNLAIRDRGGTSDPYVKFKIGGKEVFRSKTIHKNLNPVWDERVCLIVDNLQESLYIKVFDYDFGLQDDFMGSAYLYLDSLELHRC